MHLFFMMRVFGRLPILSALVLLFPVPLGSQSSPSESKLSEVQKVEQVLSELQAYESSGERGVRTHELTEGELNLYFRALLQRHDPKGVEGIAVRLKKGGFVTFMEVDLDKAEISGNSLAGSFLTNLIKGKQSLTVDGKLQVQEGVGSYTVERMVLNGEEVPGWLVYSILGLLSQSEDVAFDPTQPFRMPYGIRQVDLQPGRVTIEQ